MSTPRTAAVAALVAAIGLTAFAPAVFSAPPTNSPADRGGMQDGMQRGMQGGQMRQHMLDFRNNGGNGRFELVDLRCGTGGADRMDQRLDRITDRLELTAEQETLYQTFRTSALAAQTAFADTCATLRPASAERPADPIAAIEMRLKIDEARTASLAAVLPDLRAFYDSLSDEQKAGFMPQRMAQGQDGKGFGKPGFGRHEHRGPGHDGRPGQQPGTPPAPPAAPSEPADQDG